MVRPEIRGSVADLIGTSCRLLGGTLGSFVTGWIADRTNLSTAIAFTAGVYLAARSLGLFAS